MFKPTFLMSFGAVVAFSVASIAMASERAVSDDVIAEQRYDLQKSTQGKGFGPQSPRDINNAAGKNTRLFEGTSLKQMTLCDIHFHKNAEHKGGEFTTYAGNGDGEGHDTGFKYNKKLTSSEKKPIDYQVGNGEHDHLQPGDTIEVHFVYSTAQATLGNGLGTCLSESIKNPQLRVEAVVAVLVSDGGSDFDKMTDIEKIKGQNQVPNLPKNLGHPVVYSGSTTGPSYNEEGSPFQVTWSVRPKVVKVNIKTLADWLDDNPFDEDHAHGVRNLVQNLELLSPIK